MPSTLWSLNTTQLHHAYRNGLTTPSEVLEACLDRVHQLEPQLNAITQLFTEKARLNAAQASTRYKYGISLSPLDGIPFSAKDNIFIKDTLSTWGTPALQQNTVQKTELAIQRLLDAGAILLGKTNLCEFTLEGYTSNPLYGVTANPWDITLTPGGSSGGATASVAAGYTPFAIGTDAGGSIRRPASHCGVLGLKLGLDLVLRDHGFPPYMYDFDTLGIISRNALDISEILSIMSASPKPEPAILEGKKILYVTQLESFPVDPTILQACNKQVHALSEIGFSISETNLPIDLRFTTNQWPLMAERVLAELFNQHPEWEQQASVKFKKIAHQGRQHTPRLRQQLMHDIRQLRAETDELFQQYDFIITPATAALPWPKQQVFPNVINGENAGPRGHAIFSSWVNAAGLPAIAIPAVVSSSQLPCGIQCVGPIYSEHFLVEISQQLLIHTQHQTLFPTPQTTDNYQK